MYTVIICGGTFDRLHTGHEQFLRFAFLHGEKVIIGLTTDVYVKENKKNQNIQPFEKRKEELIHFLQKENFLKRASIVPIDSKFDQTQNLESGNVALLVTPDTYVSGIEINNEREALGLQQLQLLVCDLVTDTLGGKISSTHIREGIIDRNGMTLFLPNFLRGILRQPFGEVFTKDIPSSFLQNPEKIITIGDATTKRFLEMGIQPKIAVVDFFVERKKRYTSLQEIGFLHTENVFFFKNPAGALRPEVWETVLQLMKNFSDNKHYILHIEGEEDLLTMPLILASPLGAYIFYGQPKKGIVAIKITEAIKQQVYGILRQFITLGS